jgi:hypothetical protein
MGKRGVHIQAVANNSAPKHFPVNVIKKKSGIMCNAIYLYIFIFGSFILFDAEDFQTLASRAKWLIFKEYIQD